jgi:hypothetical protein
VLFLENLSRFGSTNKTKTPFSHHKGVIGILLMLKTIVIQDPLSF